MNFVTLADFDKLPYSIPAGDIESTDFVEFMTAAEEDVLRKFFGHVFYDLLIANALYLPEQKWVDLVDGAYYIYSGVTYKWVGLNKMLVPYLYFMRTRVTLDTHTVNGIETAKVENAIKKSPRQRLANAYNAFGKAYGVCKNQKESLYGFIITNLADYENFIYKDPKLLTPYGL